MPHHHDQPEESVEEIHLALLQALSDGMCFIDLRGAIRFWNDAAESASGFSVAEAICATHPTDVLFFSSEDGQPVSWTSIAAASEAGHFYLRHKDGHAVPVNAQSVVVRRQNEEPLGTLVLFSLLYPAREATEPTSRSLWAEEENSPALAQWPQGEGRPAGILLVQLDGFTDLEHRLGPEAGERLFAMVERTIEQCLLPGETCRRLPGGVLLVTLGPRTNLSVLGNKLLALIQSARMQWWGNFVTLTASIGGATIGLHDTIADTIRRAEDAVARASATGGNQVHLASD